METITKREKDILVFMKEKINQDGYPPTVREICKALGVRSTATVHSDILSLVRKGYLRKDSSKTRALALLCGDESSYFESVEFNRNKSVNVPIVGHVAAGTPILAEENIEDTFPVPESYINESSFMLRVRGESMINAGIFDGDLILVEQNCNINNGDIVVAMLEGFEYEATVKTFYREGDYVRLQPENDSMRPIFTKGVTVVGKVKGVFRYVN